MKTASTSALPQLIVDVENADMLYKIKNAIKIMQGVGKISVIRPSRKNKIDEAMEEVRLGQVTEWKNANEMCEKLGI